MKRFGILILCYMIPLFLSALTATDLSSRVIIDGYSTDFASDEAILTESDGALLEYNDDSRWGTYNDVRMIKLTWDAQYLYVAVDACSWNNNVLLMIDAFPDAGVVNMSDLGSWKRAFRFYRTNPDFFLATWDTNSTPQFWRMRSGSTYEADQVSVISVSTFNTGNLGRSMEAQIAWSDIYYDANHAMADFPDLKVVALITGGGDNTSGPDVAPDNFGGMPNESSTTAFIDNYAGINIDTDNNGVPDMGISPRDRVFFVKKPPLDPVSLKVSTMSFPNGKVFNMSRVTTHPIKITPNRAASFTVEVYNMEGTAMANAVLVSEDPLTREQLWNWNGLDRDGKKVPFGVYIIRAVSSSGEVSRKEAISVVR